MTRPTAKPLRCAIYTRVSIDHGLEQEFNSLDAQREVAEAYVKSQAHEGWRLMRDAFDDGGFSGGTLQRPALQRLLDAIGRRAIDVVVVYKVDRLTRSLADFAKLVELFDAQGVSFVSVTQSFNTTTSMGRLTLNMLLSFAQFEHEVTGERIRDKIAASKKKGIWVGGVVPLGYTIVDHKLHIEPAEAQTVRLIFERYREIGSLTVLLRELDDRGVRTRIRALASGRVIGGVRFTKGPLAHLLKNQTYLGRLNHRGQSYAAEHEPIIETEVFAAVQGQLAANLKVHQARRAKSKALLMGRIVDDRGHTMTPTYANKGGVRYRYYPSRAFDEGRAEEAGSAPRVSAPELEASVVAALEGAGLAARGDDAGSGTPQALIERTLQRVTVAAGHLTIALNEELGLPDIVVAWAPASQRRQREVIVPAGIEPTQVRPMRSDTRATLVTAIAVGRTWLGQMIADSKNDLEVIALREDVSRRHVHRTLSLAFLAPDIVEAAIAGRLPQGIGVSRLTELPAEWSRQRRLVGLPEKL
jgi:site-specific DNA recombinase